jgi:hypothetical protein
MLLKIMGLAPSLEGGEDKVEGQGGGDEGEEKGGGKAKPLEYPPTGTITSHKRKVYSKKPSTRKKTRANNP